MRFLFVHGGWQGGWCDRQREPVVTSSPGSREAMLSQPGPLADALLRVCA